MLDILKGQRFYNKIEESILKGRMPVKMTSVAESQKLHLAFLLCRKYDKGMVWVAEDIYSAKKAMEKFVDMTESDNAYLYPEKDFVFYETFAKNDSTESERLGTLSHMVQEKCFVFTSISAFCQTIPPKNDFLDCAMSFSRGDIYQISSICEKLSKMGYKREANVENEGQFAVRGGIVDIFPSGGDKAYRLDFFDEEIDTIKIFDTLTQSSIDVTDGFDISPAGENFAPKTVCLGDYAENMFIFADEPNTLKEAYEFTLNDLTESLLSAIESGVKLKGKKKETSSYLFDINTAFSPLYEKGFFTMSGFSMSDKIFAPKEIVNVSGRGVPSYDIENELFVSDIKFFADKGYKVIIPCGDEKIIEKVSAILDENEISYRLDTEAVLDFSVTLTKGTLTDGFEYTDIPAVYMCINSKKLKQKTEKARPKKKKNGLKSIYDINENDFVVHDIHGIGVYKGMQQMTVDGVTKDYLKIKYKGTDILYVPVHQLNLLSKYVGGSENVKVNKLGTDDWSNTKRKVRQSVEIMAKELLDLYAKRQATKGYSFGPDTELQEEFENTFIYDETDDQLKAIEEIKTDMESVRPMDRLICGDVGYGKTEIAMRGAFKAVSSGKQVAFLVPTTLLAKQHFDNFSDRMEQFAVRMEMLSRFKSPKEQTRIKENLKNGKIDIIVGTHALLQKDIEFKDLGLLIIDEEQRFGVTHKEKIKNLKCNVDVITLSATPIPRTLNMAMSGLRDMSLLNDPPKNRKPVATYVMEYSESVIRNAILKEMGRGGQVYYLHNRVDTIDIAENKLRKLVPEARIVSAHGKMSETALEKVMMQVINGEVDILVCTTIIETGIDIPNINTLIVENSERFGLAQLYQLRGRIGRSSRLAHAYLTIPKNKVLDETASKRLMAIKEFTEFGSGIKIALRDLEIRGAGSILGANQHGHLNTVGYDTYCRLLEDAVRGLKDGTSQMEDTLALTIDLNLSCYIPENYIEDKMTRIEMYREVSSIENEKDKSDIVDEFIDRFGDIPQDVINLIDITEIRNIALSMGITDISQKGEKIFFTLSPKSPIDAITEYVVNNRLETYLVSGKKINLVYTGNKKQKELCSNIKVLLQDIKSIEISKK